MTKTTCDARGCSNTPIDGSRCPEHGGFIRPENVQNQGEGDTGTEGASASDVQRLPSANPEAAVYESEPVREEPAPKRRCKATNAKGQPCRSTSVGPDGYCASHGHRTGVGTAEGGRKAAQAAARARTERSQARAAKLEEARLGLAEVLKLRALERREEIAQALITAAIQQRDVSALRLLYDRTEGKVADRLDLNSDITPEERAWIDQMRELAKLPSMTDEELRQRLEAREANDDQD